MDFKIVVGVVAALLALVSYAPYCKDIWYGRTRPHALSWLVWSVLACTGCTVQVLGGGGHGAWALAVTAVICMGIFIAALRCGERRIMRTDMVSLALAGCSLAVWFITNDPLVAALCITFTDAVGGFLPTFRKSYADPDEETALTYAINATAFVASIAALSDMSLATVLYTASLVVLNAGLALFLFWRRRTRWINRSVVWSATAH